MFDGFSPVQFPTKTYPYSVYNKENDDIVEVALAGIPKEDIDIKLVKDHYPYLLISTKKQTPTDGSVVKHGITKKSFELKLALPNHDLDNIKPELKNGLLKVVIPREKKVLPAEHTIEISD